MKLEVVNPKILPLVHPAWCNDRVNMPWRPGDFCLTWHDHSVGTIVSVINDEEILVLWSSDPFKTQADRTTAIIVKKLADDIDSEILDLLDTIYENS